MLIQDERSGASGRRRGSCEREETDVNKENVVCEVVFCSHCAVCSAALNVSRPLAVFASSSESDRREDGSAADE